MKCHVCGTENPEDAFFCGSCGAQLQSLLSGPGGPVDKIDGSIEIEPLIDQPAEAPAVSPPAQSEPPAPSPPPPAYSETPPSTYHPPAAAPQFGQPGAYPASSPYYQPPDGNTSGMGPGYPAPAVASGWTFAGCVPFGLFAFFNKSVVWGLVGLLGGFVPIASIFPIVALVYAIYIGIQGRELAWRGRKFASVGQYEETMTVWNTWGAALAVVSVLLGVLFYFVVSAVMRAEQP